MKVPAGLRGTPLHSRTGPLCQGWNWRRWAGFVVAGSYDLTHDREYWAIRSTAALIDVSPLYKYRIWGTGAERLLNRIVTRDVSGCAPGRVLYTTWCDGRGKVIEDGTLARVGEEEFRLTSAEPNLRWLHENATGLEVAIEDVSESLAALALQGPAARAVLSAACAADLADLRFFRITQGRVRGVEVQISRTGYTGDLGYEIWVRARDAVRVWDALLETGEPWGLRPTGLLALDIARIEAGLLLISVDYVSAREAEIEARTSSPFELDLGWTVAMEKESFVGSEALRRERAAGSPWQLRGLEVEWESLERLYLKVGLPPEVPSHAWRTSVPVYGGGDQIGYATSGCWSPLLKKYIALAHLRTPWANPGRRVEMEVTVEHARRRAPATVVRTPFFDPPRKRE